MREGAYPDGPPGRRCIDLEGVADAERERNLHPRVLREDVAVRVVVDLHTEIQIPVRAGEPADAHEVLEREVVSGVQAVEEDFGDIGWPGERVREVHVGEARAQERK